MKQEFTSKQREIIARKLGYDGPMQSFDAFLNSSPALQAKYNAVSDKYVQRMANGGMVKKYAVGGNVGGITDDMIRSFFVANRDNPKVVAQAAAQYKITPEKAAQALGVTVERYNNYVAQAR